MAASVDPGAATPEISDTVAPLEKSVGVRVTDLERKVEALIAELHRHVSLRLPDDGASS